MKRFDPADLEVTPVMQRWLAAAIVRYVAGLRAGGSDDPLAEHLPVGEVLRGVLDIAGVPLGDIPCEIAAFNHRRAA